MKKILIALSLAGLSVLGFTTASAQYYYGTSYDGSYTSAYSNYSYTHPSSYYYSYPYYGSSGVGSYTVGCTTYYYNTRTGATLYTQNICNNYNNYQYSNCYYTCGNSYSYPVQYTYPTSYTYPTYTTPYYYGNTSYCTYSYVNGGWYPNCSGSNYNYNYNSGSQCWRNYNGTYTCY